MIEKTEFGTTGSITDLPPEVRGNPEAAAMAAMAIAVEGEVVLSEEKPCELMPTCEVCKKNKAVGVCSVPGVRYSAAYCRQCLEADAHPYFIMVANTACCGGLEHTCEEWQEMVRHTLAHLNKSAEEFEKDVAEAIKAEDQLCEQHDHAIDALNHAAKHLCLVVYNTHTIECACETCAAACAVVDLLEPPMAEEYRKQFERRIEVQKVAKQQKERNE